MRRQPGRFSMEQEIRCNRPGVSGGICRLLEDESSIHINELLRLLQTEGSEAEIHLFLQCAGHGCRNGKLERFFAYMKILEKSPVLQALLNHSGSPVPFLESYILYLFGEDILEKGDAEETLDTHLEFLTGERLIDVLADGEVLNGDYCFLVQALSRMDNRDIDALIGRSPVFKDRIMTIFREMDYQTVFRMVLRTPEIYHYAILFFELEGLDRDVQNIQASYSHASVLAGELRNILRILHSPELQLTGMAGVDRGRMASLVSSLVLQTGDPHGVWAILENSRELQDPDLRAIIRSLIKNETRRQELGFEIRSIDLREILDWISRESGVDGLDRS